MKQDSGQDFAKRFRPQYLLGNAGFVSVSVDGREFEAVRWANDVKRRDVPKMCARFPVRTFSKVGSNWCSSHRQNR